MEQIKTLPSNLWHFKEIVHIPDLDVYIRTLGNDHRTVSVILDKLKEPVLDKELVDLVSKSLKKTFELITLNDSPAFGSFA